MRILVTGATGMLGSEVCQELLPDNEVIGIYLKNREMGAFPFKMILIDITDSSGISNVICQLSPEVVIHTAAYTDVDGCELDPDKAFLVNTQGTRNVALACKKCDAVMIYISTDYVFDGQANVPYTEDDVPHPINVYGQSKCEGEKEVTNILEKWFIVRTAWLFGIGGRNFVSTVLQLARQSQELKVVKDQFGSPSYCVDVAKQIRKMVVADAELESQNVISYGIYHVTNKGGCSRYEFAKEILKYHHNSVNIIPVVSGEFPRPAMRPRYTVLSSKRLVEDSMHEWQYALREYLSGK